MSQAAKWLDPVLGVDIHMVMVTIPPAPPIPVPLPHPFIGIVFDPLGVLASAAMGLIFSGGGPVLVNSLPVGNTGTNVKAIPHFPMPPGTAFAPFDIPGNEGVIVTGSKTVTMAGASTGRMGSLVMSCNFPINLPTSVCLAIPMGPPVIVGGPDSFDIIAALTQAIRTKWVSDRLHALFKAKPGSWRSKIICFLTGHPVDVMTGQVLTDGVDFELPGPIPLKWERNYYSRSECEGPLGRGWHHSFDASVRETAEGLVIRLADGREDWQPQLQLGETLWAEVERYWLQRTVTGYVLTNWDGRKYEFRVVDSLFNNLYRLIKIVDRYNNTIELTYHGGQLSGLIDSSKRQLRFIWTRSNRLERVEILRPASRAWELLVRYRYDTMGQLSAAVDPLENSYRYEYRKDVLVKETNRNGLSFYFEYDWYDSAGWCIRTWGDGGTYDRRLTYDKHRQVTFVEDSRGGRAHYYGNAAGLVDRKVDPQGGEWRWEWNASCQKIAEVDPLGNRTEWKYDNHGNIVLEKNALGHCISRKYNNQNLLIEHIDGTGASWLFDYDERGGQSSIKNPLGATYLFRRDDKGQLTSIQDPLGRRCTYSYHENGVIKSAQSWTGNTTVCEIDDLGWPVKLSDGGGPSIRLQWTANKRLKKISDSDGKQTAFSYDPEGNVTERTDPLGQRWTYKYTQMNKLAEERSPRGTSVHYFYDTEGQLTTIENERHEKSTFSYDLRGYLEKEQCFDSRLYSYSYDKAGRIIELRTPGGKTISLSRDNLGRTVRQCVQKGKFNNTLDIPSNVREYTYDVNGFLSSAATSSNIVHFERDALGRILCERLNEHYMKKEFHPNHLPKTRQSSAGYQADYYLNSLGNLERLEWNFAKDDLGEGLKTKRPGRIEFSDLTMGIQQRFGADIVHEKKFDHTGSLLNQNLRRKEDQILNIQYKWFTAELLSSRCENYSEQTQFAYDERSCLISATADNQATQYHVADDVGDVYRTPMMQDRQYAAGGKVVSTRDWTYYYNAEGQLVRKCAADGRSCSFAWDNFGQLCAATDSSNNKTKYDYDALGRRVRKVTDSDDIQYLWDGLQLTHELSKANQQVVTWEFDQAQESPLLKLENERAFGIATDYLGTPQVLFDETGKLAWKAQLDLFGRANLLLDETPCPWRWPGQYEDTETGLHYNLLRYYDPDLGTYISPDPIGYLGGLREYGYALNPLTHIDPLGLADFLYSMRVQIQQGNNNIISKVINGNAPITAAQVEKAMMDVIHDLPQGFKDLTSKAHGAAAQLSKKLRDAVKGNGVTQGGNVMREMLHDTNVRFDIENNRGHNLQSCK